MAFDYKAKIEMLKDKFLLARHKITSRISKTKKEQKYPSIVETFKYGNTKTRLYVLAMFALLGFSIWGTSSLVSSFFKWGGLNSKHELDNDQQRVADYMKAKVDLRESIQSMVSLGNIRLNARKRNGDAAYLKMSLYVTCDSPETATFVNENFPMFKDALITQIVDLEYEAILTTPGKKNLKSSIMAAFNQVMPKNKGRITSVIFNNMVLD